MHSLGEGYAWGICSGILRTLVYSVSVGERERESNNYLTRRDGRESAPELLDRRHPPHRTGAPTDRRVRKEGSLRE